MVRKGQYNYAEFDNTGTSVPLLLNNGARPYWYWLCFTDLFTVPQAGLDLLQDLALPTEMCKVRSYWFGSQLQYVSN